MKINSTNEIETIIDLNSLKTVCNAHLYDIARGTIFGAEIDTKIRVRFIDFEGNFGYTRLGRFFFLDDCMYLISSLEKYRNAHMPDIISYSDQLLYLNQTKEFVVRVLFAGINTGYRDTRNRYIYTGDMVSASYILNPNYPSLGGIEPAKNDLWDSTPSSDTCIEAGVSNMNNQYCMILDNQLLPLSWTTNRYVIGSLFYDLTGNMTEIDIHERCINIINPYTNKEELRRLARKSPYFPPFKQGNLFY